VSRGYAKTEKNKKKKGIQQKGKRDPHMTSTQMGGSAAMAPNSNNVRPPALAANSSWTTDDATRAGATRGRNASRAEWVRAHVHCRQSAVSDEGGTAMIGCQLSDAGHTNLSDLT